MRTAFLSVIVGLAILGSALATDPRIWPYDTATGLEITGTSLPWDPTKWGIAYNMGDAHYSDRWGITYLTDNYDDCSIGQMEFLTDYCDLENAIYEEFYRKGGSHPRQIHWLNTSAFDCHPVRGCGYSGKVPSLPFPHNEWTWFEMYDFDNPQSRDYWQIREVTWSDHDYQVVVGNYSDITVTGWPSRWDPDTPFTITVTVANNPWNAARKAANRPLYAGLIADGHNQVFDGLHAWKQVLSPGQRSNTITLDPKTGRHLYNGEYYYLVLFYDVSSATSTTYTAGNKNQIVHLSDSCYFTGPDVQMEIFPKHATGNRKIDDPISIAVKWGSGIGHSRDRTSEIAIFMPDLMDSYDSVNDLYGAEAAPPYLVLTKDMEGVSWEEDDKITMINITVADVRRPWWIAETAGNDISYEIATRYFDPEKTETYSGQNGKYGSSYSDVDYGSIRAELKFGQIPGLILTNDDFSSFNWPTLDLPRPGVDTVLSVKYRNNNQGAPYQWNEKDTIEVIPWCEHAKLNNSDNAGWVKSLASHTPDEYNNLTFTFKASDVYELFGYLGAAHSWIDFCVVYRGENWGAAYIGNIRLDSTQDTAGKLEISEGRNMVFPSYAGQLYGAKVYVNVSGGAGWGDSPSTREVRHVSIGAFPANEWDYDASSIPVDRDLLLTLDDCDLTTGTGCWGQNEVYGFPLSNYVPGIEYRFYWFYEEPPFWTYDGYRYNVQRASKHTFKIQADNSVTFKYGAEEADGMFVSVSGATSTNPPKLVNAAYKWELFLEDDHHSQVCTSWNAPANGNANNNVNNYLLTQSNMIGSCYGLDIDSYGASKALHGDFKLTMRYNTAPYAIIGQISGTFFPGMSYIESQTADQVEFHVLDGVPLAWSEGTETDASTHINFYLSPKTVASVPYKSVSLASLYNIPNADFLARNTYTFYGFAAGNTYVAEVGMNNFTFSVQLSTDSNATVVVEFPEKTYHPDDEIVLKFNLTGDSRVTANTWDYIIILPQGVTVPDKSVHKYLYTNSNTMVAGASAVGVGEVKFGGLNLTVGTYTVYYWSSVVGPVATTTLMIGLAEPTFSAVYDPALGLTVWFDYGKLRNQANVSDVFEVRRKGATSGMPNRLLYSNGSDTAPSAQLIYYDVFVYDMDIILTKGQQYEIRWLNTTGHLIAPAVTVTAPAPTVSIVASTQSFYKDQLTGSFQLRLNGYSPNETDYLIVSPAGATWPEDKGTNWIYIESKSDIKPTQAITVDTTITLAEIFYGQALLVPGSYELWWIPQNWLPNYAALTVVSFTVLADLAPTPAPTTTAPTPTATTTLPPVVTPSANTTGTGNTTVTATPAATTIVSAPPTTTTTGPTPTTGPSPTSGPTTGPTPPTTLAPGDEEDSSAGFVGVRLALSLCVMVAAFLVM